MIHLSDILFCIFIFLFIVSPLSIPPRTSLIATALDEFCFWLITVFKIRPSVRLARLTQDSMFNPTNYESDIFLLIFFLLDFAFSVPFSTEFDLF